MKKTIISFILFTAISIILYAQYRENDFEVDNGGNIKYHGNETNIVIPSRVKGKPVRSIPAEAFKSKNLTSVIIPNTVNDIGRAAFMDNHLTNITIPNSVTHILDDAFRNNKLTVVNIMGDNVRYGNNVFKENPLTNIYVGKDHNFTIETVSKIDDKFSSFFYDYICNNRNKGLYVINIPIIEISEGDFIFVKTQYGSFLIDYHGSDDTVIIPDKLGGFPVKGISGLDNKKIKNIHIPDSILYIANRAFANNLLTNVNIPNSVNYIGYGAFTSNQLINIKIPDSVTYLGGDSFSYNKLIEVTLPNNITEIGGSTFRNNKITSVIIPNGVTIIHLDAFMSNELTSVILPNSITMIHSNAFDNNPINNITIGKDVYLCDYSFEDTFIYAYDIKNKKMAGTYIRSQAESTKSEYSVITRKSTWDRKTIN